jgi:predicted phage tail protein
MRDIYVYGSVGKEFGRHWRLSVSSPAEALRALCSLRPRIKQAFTKGNWRVIVGKPHIKYSIDQYCMGMNGTLPIHIVPSTQPHGGGGMGKIFAGIALIGFSVITAGLGAAAAGGFFAAMGATASVAGIGLGVTYGTIALMGAGLLLGGISMMMATPPQSDSPTDQAGPTDRPSFLFNGVTNNSQQGGPVPLVLGKHLVGSVVVSAGLNSEDIPV